MLNMLCFMSKVIKKKTMFHFKSQETIKDHKKLVSGDLQGLELNLSSYILFGIKFILHFKF